MATYRRYFDPPFQLVEQISCKYSHNIGSHSAPWLNVVVFKEFPATVTKRIYSPIAVAMDDIDSIHENEGSETK